LIAVPHVTALAVTVQSNVAITVPSSSQGGGSLLPAYRNASANWQSIDMTMLRRAPTPPL
jgi:hypothetical protein